MAVSCETVWLHSRCPPATTALTRSGYAWACVPTMQNVAFTPLSFRSCSTWGVQVGSGPSSMVMLTPRAPRSEACAMSSATLVTARSWCRASGAETRASGCRPPAVSACAVQTEVAAAIAVTPSAAATSRLCQPLPLCFAMSARPFVVSAVALRPSRHMNGPMGCLGYRSRTNLQGLGDKGRRSATKAGGRRQTQGFSGTVRAVRLDSARLDSRLDSAQTVSGCVSGARAGEVADSQRAVVLT
ncbi:hypothetical protein ACVWYT_004782 [Streptomyces sp. TE4109]